MVTQQDENMKWQSCQVSPQLLFLGVLRILSSTLQFNMKGAFDRSYSGIRLYLKFLLQISSRVIFDHVNVTYKFIK